MIHLLVLVLITNDMLFLHRTKSFSPNSPKTIKSFYPNHILFASNEIVKKQRAFFTKKNQDNKNEVLKEMYKESKSILWEGINAVHPRTAIKNHVKIKNNILQINDDEDVTYNLSNYRNVIVFGIGKASSGMAYELANIFKNNNHKIDAGIVITKDNHTLAEEKEYLKRCNVTIYEASHPIPDERGVHASQKLLHLAKSYPENTLFLCCISGGGSSLFITPKAPFITLSSLKQTNTILLQSGMDITNINIIRKCLEEGKGGGLANALDGENTTLITLILSDVVNDDLHSIASAPTVFPTYNTYECAYHLIKQYNLETKLPTQVIELIHNEVHNKTVKYETAARRNNHVFLVGNNALAVTAAATQAKKLGYKPMILSTTLQGEAKEVGKVFMHIATSISQNNLPYSLRSYYDNEPICLLAGGETTVTLPFDNTGLGGRNQELGLSAAITLHELNQNNKYNNIVFTSIGTDGTDGPTDAAGVSIDANTISRIKEYDDTLLSASNALKHHDAYNYFCNYTKDCEFGDGLIFTGATGTNVADIYFTLIR